MYTVYIDESGTLPDKNDKLIVLSAVCTRSPAKITDIFKRLKRGKSNNNELKFYKAGHKTKVKFFKELIKENVGIFILEVNKNNRIIKDTPENFAVLCWLLLIDVLNFYSNPLNVIFDRHFSTNRDITKFNKSLTKLLPNLSKIEHVDSIQNQNVNVADMVAGATLASERGKNGLYYDLISKKVMTKKQINWIEAKRRFVNKKLA
jgi:hypothetical protein